MRTALVFHFGKNKYLHDDTSHNVLEGLLELCEAVASNVTHKIAQT